jgi:SAM-dependent methyltransferase
LRNAQQAALNYRERGEDRLDQVTDWTSGYVADVNYSFGYYAELNPLRTRMVLLNGGLAPPRLSTACELGFGQGVSVNVHAAASDIAWWGTDFNPSHATGAQELAVASGARVSLYDEAFADFCHRPDLPDFDSIGVHGVWSWISDENRAAIVDFIRRKLRPGGVAYFSYNTLPGHAPTLPLRHLLLRHTEVMGAPGQGLVPRIDATLAFAKRLMEQGPAVGVALPTMGARLDRILGEDRHYVAHEYFNRDWRLMHFDELAQQLSGAKLTYAGSAHHLDHIPLLNLSEEQNTFLNEIPDPIFRETARDFVVNQQFRRDYFVKGSRRLSTLERFEATLGERFALTTSRDAVTLSAAGSAGEKTLRGDIYQPLLDALADHHPKTFGELLLAFGQAEGGFAQVFEAMMVLMGKGDVAPAQAEATIAAARPSSDRLNAALLTRARSDQSIGVLASPVTGGGVPLGRFEQLFLLARARGSAAPQEWAAFTWKCLSDQGQRVVVEGKVLESPQENLAELSRQATAFDANRLPVLKALLVA